MYLWRKPENTSLLAYLDPWPVYLGGGEVVVFLLFSLRALLFRQRKA